MLTGSPLFCSFVEALWQLPGRFYLFAVIHAVYILVFHVLQNFVPHYVTLRWGDSVVRTGYIAALPPLLVSHYPSCRS